VTRLGRGAPSWLKAAVRTALRASGYTLVPAERSFTELRRRLLPGCDLLVDVGANVGQYVREARALGYRGPVVSFEPQAEAFATLESRASAVPGWQARHVALGQREGEAELMVSANSVSSSLLAIRPETVAALASTATVARETVQVSTLDRQLAGTPGNALWLKLDVQGVELDVLHGGADTLARTRVVQCEMSLRPLYDRQTDYVELVTHLRRAGFTMCHLEPVFHDGRTGQVLQVDALFTRLDPPSGPEVVP
jgi:FkbM family methyltransferase